MAYISKVNILAAYKKLSEMFPDPNAQGATQKVSAIRYFVALDRFYKIHGTSCDTREKHDRDEFASLVGLTSDVCLDLYTANFYYPLKKHTGDYCVGSNFYSAGQVSASLVAPQRVFDYPKRGNIPLFKVQNGKLIRDVDLYKNLKNYIQSTEYAVALAIWIIRKINININENKTVYEGTKNTLSSLFTTEFMTELLKDEKLFETILDSYGLTFNNNFYSIREHDIEEICEDFENNEKIAIPMFFPFQTILYGAPGTGKSYEVKNILLAGVPENQIFRTTFHPDYDYASFVGCYKPKPDEEGKIKYEFVPQIFTKAYIAAKLHPETQYYIVIEEINRGNCAQIFGDLFQLLDRKDGVSEYPVIGDEDMMKYIGNKIGSDIETLSLPQNLSIIATMNTSDQSLFPMDSAFKRRWDMQYVPIKYSGTDADNFTITITKKQTDNSSGKSEDKTYSWIEFLKVINEKIKSATSSADKQMGEFFIRHSVGAKEFKDKVMFYLWNDVCKDLYNGKNSPAQYFMRTKEGVFTFEDLYVDEKGDKLLADFLGYILPAENQESSDQSETAAE